MTVFEYVFVFYCCFMWQLVVSTDPKMGLDTLNKTVTSDSGTFIGKVGVVEWDGNISKVKMFLGIRYAKSPIGDLRFKKTTPLRSFEAPYDATEKGALCLNRDALLTGNMASQDGGQMSEDCLFLNIYVPFEVNHGEEIPVIIFIHEKDLDITQISEITNGFIDVVFVQIQYRMNLWGFLVADNPDGSPGKSGPNQIKGNAGLWDQHFAIKWVHENIRAFGGNPDLVTLFGYFEGASNVLYQAMFEENVGMFKRLNVNCGAVRCPWAINKLPSQTTRMVGRALDCRNDTITEIVSCISLKTTEEILYTIKHTRTCIQYPYATLANLVPYETLANLDGTIIKRLPHEILDPFSSLETKERMLLSKYDILTAVNQEGNWWKPSSWMSVRVSNASIEKIFLGKRHSLGDNDPFTFQNNITDTNVTSQNEEMYKFVHRYMINSMFSDTYQAGVSGQNIGDFTYKEFPEMCYLNETESKESDMYFVSDQIFDLARVMFGLDFDQKAIKRLNRDVSDCNYSISSTFSCIISSYHLGGPLWKSKRYCHNFDNKTITEFSKFSNGNGSDPFRAIAPPVHNFDDILVFDSMSDHVCRVLSSRDDVNQSDHSARKFAGRIWTSFAKTGALSSVVALGANIICNKIPGLAPRQRAICRSRPVAIAVIGGGARLGLNECQYQFRNMRWNCTMASKYDSMFGYQHDIASREAAVWSAMASSGVVYAITQACSLGTLNECGCDKSKMNFRQYSKNSHDFMWGGCSADVKYGLKLARKFLDAREIEQTARSLMNKHNNKVGRKAVRDNMKLECRCHGPTGSCSMKTCWRRLPSFRDVGDYLLKQYHKSKQVVPWRGSRLLRPNALVLKKSNRPNKKPRRRDLVFLELSPNFCEYNLTTGSLGTVGRKCEKGSRGNDGCTLMCCGRGYNTHQYTRIWQCNCTFRWCCEVNCKNCTEKRLEYTCK